MVLIFELNVWITFRYMQLDYFTMCKLVFYCSISRSESIEELDETEAQTLERKKSDKKSETKTSSPFQLNDKASPGSPKSQTKESTYFGAVTSPKSRKEVTSKSDDDEMTLPPQKSEMQRRQSNKSVTSLSDRGAVQRKTSNTVSCMSWKERSVTLLH